ncbi:hypothetical protein jhhlp_008644 [Lomentospora prolificans]|uniref:RBR-type E3 ubiquitin transferase n=1 Tax=Lomentospora prolificans TaxID=41688 RepID=A0A2N3MYM2_9PEZI|nr:hypothetical protein jhhlp_008644 [Lomentospora prolificans]
MDDANEDLRLDELGSLEAIFPEIQRSGDPTNLVFTLEVPVKPANSVTVVFPAAVSTDTAPDPTAVGTTVAAHAHPQNYVASHQLSYLPAILIRISLPEGYPTEKPPQVTLTTTPPWLAAGVVKTLEGDAERLWEEMGRDMVAFSYIDHVQQAAENVFGMVNPSGNLEIDLAHMVSILDYDIQARRVAFENESFDCGVCLDPKKGRSCHKMNDCGHVFCLSCLRDYYTNAIVQGDLVVVKCLSPGCAKEREAAHNNDPTKKGRKPRIHLSPGELVAIGLDQDLVSRYVSLKYKKELESDKTTVYCPRKWCNGAAISKRHKKPRGLEFVEPDDNDDGTETNQAANGTAEGGTRPEAGKDGRLSKTEDLLRICEDCGFAFCSRCYQSWHGEFFRCRAKCNGDELSEEEKASLEYISKWTRPCASCEAPAQKTEGCNHMICFRCNTHFCYLCSSWLDPQNPYSHFNNPGYRDCYQRLWDYQTGHGENNDFHEHIRQRREVAQRRERPNEPPFQIILAQPEIEEPEDNIEAFPALGGPVNGEIEWDQDAGRPRHREPNVQVAREGPLVLRIDQGPERRAVPPPVPAPPMQPDDQRGGPRVQRGRRGGGDRGRGRGWGGRGGGPAGGAGPGAGRGGLPPGRGQHQAGGPARDDFRQIRRGAPRNQNQNNRQPRRRQQGQEQGGQAQEGQAAGHIRHLPMLPLEVVEHDGEEPDELNEEQLRWVRRFVELALIDEEESGSDDDVAPF